MATIRNLNNIIKAEIPQEYHEMVKKYLTDQNSVKNS